MLYSFPLKWVAVVLGLLYVIGHLPGVLAPQPFCAFLKKLPRHPILGPVLMVLAIAWFCYLTHISDLGEIAMWRTTLIGLWITGGAALVFYVPTFLVGRGLGCLLMLGASLLLDAAFMQDSSWRLIITLTAYAWVVAGSILVCAPHYFRDMLLWATKTPDRCRALSVGGVVYGSLLMIIALAFF